jgi:prephenate dehydrogenase
MKIGIAGMGLIGGSFAKAYKLGGEALVYGHDIDKGTLETALLSKAIDGILDENTIGSCACILIALCPGAAIEYMRRISPLVSQNAMIIDCCGTKRKICAEGFRLAQQYGFTFVGGHPMAGTQYSGFKYARASILKGASMIVVPPVHDDIALLQRVKDLLGPVGFARLVVTTPEKHDRMIAFTSQMAHLVSNAFVKSPTALGHKGFSAGSYKDLTRVAWLNEHMWAELFLENKDNLLEELNLFIGALRQYRSAIAENDFDRLKDLLFEGRKCKEEAERL